MNRLMQLAEIINSRRITVVRQPIIELETGEIVGNEALARGPAGYFEAPETLFRCARDYGMLLDLDRVCFELALAGLRPGLNFVNLAPESVATIAVPRQEELRGRLVIEVTETALDGILEGMEAVFSEWRAKGVMLAVDDVGKGGLASVARLRPDFLKIDRSLVRDCHRSFVSRAILKHLNLIAADIGALCVAEGIERPEELEAVRAVGIKYGQGYLLGRPAMDEVAQAARKAAGG